MRNAQKRKVIALWDLVLLRLLIPVWFPLSVKKKLGIFKGVLIYKREVFPQRECWNWIGRGMIGGGLILVFGYCALTFYFHFKLFSEKRICYSEEVRKWRMGRNVSVFEASGVSLACICGVWNSVILCSPLLETKKEQAFLILEHEWNHILHNDVIRKHIVQLLACFHWYNPAFWILAKWILDDMEIACDEAVIEKYGDAFRVEYAKLLISTIKVKNAIGRTYFNKHLIERRVRYVIQDKKRSHLTCLGILAAFLVIGASCLKLVVNEKKSTVNNYVLYETEWSEESVGYVNTDALKMRKEPFGDADVVTLLKKEQTVNILAEQNEFYQILIQAEDETDETLEGYVKKEYINIE